MRCGRLASTWPAGVSEDILSIVGVTDIAGVSVWGSVPDVTVTLTNGVTSTAIAIANTQGEIRPGGKQLVYQWGRRNAFVLNTKTHDFSLNYRALNLATELGILSSTPSSEMTWTISMEIDGVEATSETPVNFRNTTHSGLALINAGASAPQFIVTRISTLNAKAPSWDASGDYHAFRLEGRYDTGSGFDVGTPERLSIKIGTADKVIHGGGEVQDHLGVMSTLSKAVLRSSRGLIVYAHPRNVNAEKVGAQHVVVNTRKGTFAIQTHPVSDIATGLNGSGTVSVDIELTIGTFRGEISIPLTKVGNSWR